MKINQQTFVLFVILILCVEIFGQVTKNITFTDDFESGSSQWILNDGWGLDTQFVKNGTYSLSDSPDSNYVDSTDLLPEGGSVAQIDQVFNFSNAYDGDISFWMRYDIEEDFDYLYFQVCKDGENWVTKKTWTGKDTVWTDEFISLGLYAGESSVEFRFLLKTDLGINEEGANIDDLNLTMLTEQEPTPPYVIYSKEKDYYDNNPEGFEISAELLDFGLNYDMKVLFSVEGSVETPISPYNIDGGTYEFIIPNQNWGSLVEFRFDCFDSEEPPNHWYYGPHYYIAGLHQKYDSGVVTNYENIVTSTNLNDIKSFAVKFTSSHEDIVGVLVRGYDDNMQLEDNSQMVINVWSEDDGLPGPMLMPPFAVPNPATLQENTKWVYVDLSSYYNLNDMSGDYFIGIECAQGETGVTRSLLTDTDLPEFPDEICYERSYKQYYSASGLVWEEQDHFNYHIRCVTTNYAQWYHGIIDADPDSLSKVLQLGSSDSDILNINNVGAFTLHYTGRIEFDDPENSWLTLDGDSIISGTVGAMDSDPVSVGFNTVGLESGNYSATIILESDYSTDSVPVYLSVMNSPLPPVSNGIIRIEDGNIVLEWDELTGATGYNVYYSNDPYGSFLFLGTVGTNQYIEPVSQARRFYYITAIDE